MPILGILASSFAAAGDFESIATVTVGSGGSSAIDFTSIPSTFTHLQLRWTGRSTFNNSGNGVNLYVQFNGDGGSNYAIHQLRGTGSSVLVAGGANQTGIYPGLSVADAGASTNVFGSGVYDVLDYANTNKFKTTRLLNGYDNNGAGVISFSSGLWMNTAVINRIVILVDATWAQHTTFALYGIRAA